MRSTRFFWNYLHDYDLHDPTEQKDLDADPAFVMNAIVVDAPLVHFRRTLARMIAEECEAPGQRKLSAA